MKKNYLLISGVAIIVALLALFVFKNPIINSSKNLVVKLIPTPTPKALTKLKVVMITGSAARPEIAVATKEKIFEKYGLVVEEVQVQTGNAMMDGLVGGKVDLAISVSTSPLKAAAAGAKIKSVGNFNNNSERLFVSRKNANEIKTYCAAGLTTEDYLAGVKVLKNLGIDVANLQVINLNSLDLCAKALVAGSADSTVFLEPNWEKLKLVNKEVTTYPVILRAVGQNFLKKPLTILVMENTLVVKKQDIENFSKAIVEANYWLRSHSEGEIAKTITNVNAMTKQDALVYGKLSKGYLANIKFTQDLSNVEAIRKENEGVSPKLKDYDVKNFLSTVISDSLTKQGFLQKYGF